MRERDPEVGMAIEAAGGATALAKIAGVRMESIYSWRRIPAGRVEAIAEALKISPDKLRPDLAKVFNRQAAA